MASTHLIYVEGPHDLIFTKRIIQRLGYRSVSTYAEARPLLGSDWEHLIKQVNQPASPATPHEAIIAPCVLQKEVDCCIIAKMEGDNFAKLLGLLAALRSNELRKLASFGLVIDADEHDPVARVQTIASVWPRALGSEPQTIGIIQAGPPKTGCFVLPDGQDQGTIEKVLLSCAESRFAGLAGKAREFVEALPIAADQIADRDLKQFNKPSGKTKAMMGCIGNQFRPGRPMYTAIDDIDFLNDDTERLADVAPYVQFIRDLIS